MHAGKKNITWPNGEAPQVARSKAAFVLFKAEQGWEADQAKAFPPLNYPQGATARLPHCKQGLAKSNHLLLEDTWAIKSIFPSPSQ